MEKLGGNTQPTQGKKHLLLCCGPGEHPDSLYFLLLRLQEALAYAVSQVLCFYEPQVTLLGVGGQPGLVEF